MAIEDVSASEPWAIEREFSFGGWAAQWFLAYLGPVFALTVLESLAGATDSAVWQVTGYLVVLLLAGASALGVSVVGPSSPKEGRMVWVLPVAVEVILFIWAVSSEGIQRALLLFYVGSGPTKGGEASWGLVLFTLPMWSCCCYSAAMHWRWRQQRVRR
jgi:hypothetical protein